MVKTTKTRDPTILVNEEMPGVQVIDENNEVVVLYKPRRKGTRKSQTHKGASVSPAEIHDVDQTNSNESSPSPGKQRSHRGSSRDKSKKTRKGKSSNPSSRGFTEKDIPELHLTSKHLQGSEESKTSLQFEDLVEAAEQNKLGGNFIQTCSRRGFTEQDKPVDNDDWRQAEEFTMPLPSRDLEQASDNLNSSSRYFAAEDLPKAEPAKTSSASCSDRLNYRTRSAFKEMMRFKALKLAQVLLALYVGILTYADMGPPGGLRDTETGLIVDQESTERTAMGLILVNGTERAIVGVTQFQVVCIGITRMSAFFMYPALVFVFISKFRATQSFLAKTPLAMYMYKDSHELHIYCGWTILMFSTIHAVFHLARWGQQGNLNLLIDHFSGMTGLIMILSCLLICIPMTLLRDRIRYEIRKNLHYLFLLFALALVFHTPSSAVPNGGFTGYVFGTILIWYFLDATYCYFFMTEKIDTTKFSVLPSGVRMTMTVSKRFQKMGAQGGICYVCLPWVNKDQWHAFSLFENPSNPAERQIFIQKTGDWTTKVHRILQRDTVRPAWIHGPFPSPYDNAESYDNQILVASGIGITPALSVIRAHKDSRRINLIWAVRDQALLEFFLRHLYLDHQGWNLIFYTGKEKLRGSSIDMILSNTNVCVIEGRPKLGELIPNIIYGIESNLGLPENYNPDTTAIAAEMLVDRLEESHRTAGSAPTEIAEDLACYASELGFHLPTDKMSQEFDLFHSSGGDLVSPERTPSRRRASHQSIIGHLAMGFRPWDRHEGSKAYVKNLDKKLIIPTWGMLYCGGAKQVLSELENISDEYQFGLHVESFAW